MKNINHSISCYTSSIISILKYYNINKYEEELFYSRKLLELKCESECDGIYTDLEKVVNIYLNDCGIEVRDIETCCYSELMDEMKKRGILLLKIDCRHLEYADVFKNAFTQQRKHYVVIKNIMESYIEILDTYIPSTPITSYEGRLIISKEELINMEFKYVDVLNLRKRKITYTALCIEMLHEYLATIDGNYKQFISNINDIRLLNIKGNKILVYEMATALSVSGTIASRKIFYTLLKKIKMSEDLLIDMSKVVSKYNALRLLLLKAYVKFSLENLDDILQKAHETIEFECILYKKLYIWLTEDKKRNR